jgi:hypothetical protein
MSCHIHSLRLLPLLSLHLRISELGRPDSVVGRIEPLELLLRRMRCSHGSAGCSPENLANKLRMSVKEMTPLRRPEMRAPAMADAGTADEGTGDKGMAWAECEGPRRGVDGADGDGDPESTTHIRCDLVATSFATVCAKVE